MEWETEFPSQILFVDFQFPTLNEGAPSRVLDSPSDPCEFPAQKFLCPNLSLTSCQCPGILTPHLHNSISSWGISTLSWNGNGSCCLFLTCWDHLKMPVQIVLALVLLSHQSLFTPPENRICHTDNFNQTFQSFIKQRFSSQLVNPQPRSVLIGISTDKR